MKNAKLFYMTHHRIHEEMCQEMRLKKTSAQIIKSSLTS